MSIDVPKPKTLEESLREEENDIRQRFERYKDVEFQIYQDSICNHSELGHLNGHPEYFSFLKEVDYMLQYAILKEVDTIICFDKSARGFGLLANKLFPVVRLERAKMMGVDPNSIKKPEIKFVDFPRIYYGNINLFDGVVDYVSKISESEEKVLLFDESSYQKAPRYSLWDISGREPNRWNFLENIYLVDRFGGDVLYDYPIYTNMGPNIERVKALLSEKIPNKKFYYQIGTSDDVGGLDRSVKRIKLTAEINSMLYSIINPKDNLLVSGLEDEFYFSNMIDELIDVFLDIQEKEIPQIFRINGYSEMTKEEKIEAIKKWLTRFSQQIRDEHSRMVWELFKQIILKDDLYKRK